MGKRNQHTREEIKQLAIDAAEVCIIEQGVQGINARSIAKEIGYAVGTLYQLFKGMDLLILEVNMRSLLALETRLRQVVATQTHANRAIESMVMTYVDYALQETNRWQAIFEHRLPNGVDAPESYLRRRSQLFALLEQQLASIYPEKGEQELVLEARALWAGVHGVCTLALLDKLDDDGLSIKDIVRILVLKFNTGDKP